MQLEGTYSMEKKVLIQSYVKIPHDKSRKRVSLDHIILLRNFTDNFIIKFLLEKFGSLFLYILFFP